MVAAASGTSTTIDGLFVTPQDPALLHAEDRLATRIGKELQSYNALDTGLFLITPKLIEALDRVNGPDGCSLSQGVAALASEGRMKAAEVGDAIWIDVDTPEAHAEAERLIALLGEDLDGSASRDG